MGWWGSNGWVGRGGGGSGGGWVGVVGSRGWWLGVVGSRGWVGRGGRCPWGGRVGW